MIKVPASMISIRERIALGNELEHEVIVNALENKLADTFTAIVVSSQGETNNPSLGTAYGNAPTNNPNEQSYFFARMRRTDIDEMEKPDPFLSKTRGRARKLANMHPLGVLLRSEEGKAPQIGEKWTCRYLTKDRKGIVLMQKIGVSQNFLALATKESPFQMQSTNFSDGMVGDYGATTGEISTAGPHPYKGVLIQGSVFPGDAIRSNKKINPNKHIREKYLPALEKAMAGEAKGMKLLATAMAIKEGFYPNTRAYKYNNPGNIGNTDSGDNVGYPTLEEGIKKQKTYILSVANGTHRAYPLGKQKNIKPYYSKEIAKNQKTYKKSPYVPGYSFVYTGQIDQFVKIYATGSRSGNGYLNLILSYFNQNGISITPQSKIQDIIKLT